MKKLTSEQRKQLENTLMKLEKLDSNNNYNEIFEELSSATNEFAGISNNLMKVDDSSDNLVSNNEKISKKDAKNKINELDNIKNKLNVAKTNINFDEIKKNRQNRSEKIENDIENLVIIDNDMIFDLLKSIIEKNQQCIDECLVVLENSSDKYAKQIKKCLDNNIDSKRILKNVYKALIDELY